MKIIHVASEFNPIAKVGGLGDVVHGLSKELVQQGHEVEVILPKYDILNLQPLRTLAKKSFLGFYTVWQAVFDHVPLTLLSLEDEAQSLKRGRIYGEADDAARFLLFCKAASDYVSKIKTSILHLHDWHTSALVLKNPGVKKVLTIHNANYRGCTSPQLLQDFATFNREKWSDPLLKDSVSLLRGGIECADSVTTVSPTYANEICEPKGSCLYPYLKKAKLKGILNGLDIDYWNPYSDPHLGQTFSSDLGESKKANRLILQKMYHMGSSKGPLVGVISRLVPQKGLHLIKEALFETIRLGGQAILLGSSPDPSIQEAFLSLARTYKKEPNLHFEFEFNESLAHKIYAASDLILVPSLFEPCGLTQMIAMRYGALPLVRETGGLKDTVFNGSNGFTFKEAEKQEIQKTLQHAFKIYHEESEQWALMRAKAHKFKRSWNQAAKEYLKIYSEVLTPTPS
ncbi:MAG: glycogen/starch synthase [Simkaniaceae bacterium]